LKSPYNLLVEKNYSIIISIRSIPKKKTWGVELDDDALEYSRFGTWSCRLVQEGKMSYNYFKKGEPR